MAATAFGADYGQRVSYKKGQTLAFPDAELTFLGSRRVASAVYPRGFLYYDFKAASHGATKDISWSGGTGEIGPLSFEVDGKKFVLELKHSDAFKGWLKDDELVFWTQAGFEALKKK